MVVIDLLKVIYCTPFLLYSCYTDILTRRVSNQVWKVMLAGSVLFVAYDLYYGGIPAFVKLLLSAGFIFVFVYILFQFGAFGGADAKSLIVLAVILPTYPQLIINGVEFPIKGVPLIDLFSFSVFGNAVLLTIVVPFSLCIYNLVTLKPSEILERPAYIFVGFKTEISKLLDRHIKLIEELYLSEGEVKTKFKRGGVGIDENTIKQLETLADDGLIETRVWVTPGLPFMIPITLGFFAAVLFGDLIFFISKLLLTMG
jgi:preflagellin peptidase FlaK